jgi:SAM-dependent methyltransferase
VSQGACTRTDDFDDFAQDYAETLDESLIVAGAGREYFALNRVDWVRTLERRAGRRPLGLLDLGCGDGLTDQFLAEAFPSARITGVDVSAECIRVAESRDVPRCEFRVYDGENIPLADESTDLVLLAGVLHHVPDDGNRARLMTEIHRVLRSAGSVYVFEQNPLNPVTRRIVDRCPFDRHARLLRASETVSLIRGNGFESIDLRYMLFAPRHRVFTLLHRIEPMLKRVPFGAQYFVAAVRT